MKYVKTFESYISDDVDIDVHQFKVIVNGKMKGIYTKKFVRGFLKNFIPAYLSDVDMIEEEEDRTIYNCIIGERIMNPTRGWAKSYGSRLEAMKDSIESYFKKMNSSNKYWNTEARAQKVEWGIDADVYYDLQPR